MMLGRPHMSVRLVLIVAGMTIGCGGAVAVREDPSAFAARCRGELVQRDPDAGRWAASSCKEKWGQAVATGPMVDALLRLVPGLAGPAPTVAAVKARLKAVHWQARPAGKALAGGTLGDLDVTVEGGGTVETVSFGWMETGKPIPYDAVEALRMRGITPATIGCLAFGASESAEAMRVAAPGRAPFALTVYTRGAPTADAWSIYSVTVDLTGKIPTLAGLRATDGGAGWTTECPA